MKKIIIPIILLTFLTGCSNKQDIFETSAKTYYENHMKMVNNLDSVTITLEDLQNASDEDGYDLTKLKKCEKNSKITFFIDKNTKEINDKKIELNC